MKKLKRKIAIKRGSKEDKQSYSPSSFTNSEVKNILISSCFLKAFSSGQIGQLSDNAYLNISNEIGNFEQTGMDAIAAFSNNCQHAGIIKEPQD